jgi:hemolysin activation/secretion protein
MFFRMGRRQFRKASIRAGLSAMLMMSAAPVWGQAAPPRFSVPDAGQVLRPPPLPRNGAPSVPAMRPRPELPVSKQTRIRFNKVRVIGAGVLPPARIAALFAGLKDREIPIAALKPVLDQVDALYVNAGYPLGRALVPAQRIKGGILTVRVLEGYVDRIAVTADNARTKALVEKMAAPLLKERPLTRAALERVILLIQDVPGITLGSKFEAMNPATGGTRLRLAAKVQWATVGLSLDNRANLQSLPFQPYATTTFNDLLGWGDRISMTALLSPRQKDYAFYDLGFSRLVGRDGLTMGLEGSWAQTFDPVSLKPYQVRARSQRLAASAAYPLIRSKAETLNLQGGFYYAGSIYSLANTPVGNFAHDKNLALQLGGDYTRIFSPDLGLGGNIHLTQGIANFTNEPHTRLHTIPGFTKLSAQLRLAWQPVDNLLLKFGTMGQYSPDSLIASEEVAFGGLAYGRGFNTSEIAGDDGIGFSFQPEYTIALGGGFSVTPYPLFDYAKVHNRPGDLEPDGELVSAGFGVRLAAGDLGSTTLELDKPLNRIPFERRDKGWRVFAGFELGVDSTLSLIEQTL